MFLALSGLPALGETAMDRMFPDKSGCYARNYSAGHLAAHPEQQVTNISVVPEAEVAEPQLGLWMRLTLRQVRDPGAAGNFEALAYCEDAGRKSLECFVEGDAGSFTVTPAKKGWILIKVGRYDVSLENAQGFAKLEHNRGDDQEFLLRPVACN